MDIQTQPQEIIQSIDQQIKYIQSNRKERNKRYHQCMSSFKDFLENQTEQFASGQAANTHNKELVSQAFQSTFQRILNASDLTIRKIKQTFNQKKIFWENVIKMNSQINDLQLKKEFYIQKRNAEEGYLEAVDRQKDKHKSYKSLINTDKKKQTLRQFQQNNRTFEEKVIEGTHTMQHWQSLGNQHKHNKQGSLYGQLPQARGIINQFVDPKYLKAMNSMQAEPLRPNFSVEVENSTSFLNNFQRKR